MALDVYREFQGKLELVGGFTDAVQHDRMFEYDAAYLQQENSHALSLSLPLSVKPYPHKRYAPFFDGMIPEGPVRTELAHRFQIPVSDGLGLLERIGGECVGALMFLPHGMDPSVQKPSYRRLKQEDIDGLIAGEVVAMATNMQESRLSLAGAQSKTGWLLPEGKDPKTAQVEDWLAPEGSAPSTHIIKVSAPGHEDLPYNEHVCMEAASMCGLKTAKTWVPSFMPKALISERYDRIWLGDSRSIDGVRVPLRLHQEDFCQANGWPSYLKYENDPYACYARTCGNLIRETSSDAIADVRSFAMQLVFDYLVGNCDSHMKNHSLLFSPDWESKRLAPTYDVVCTTIMGYDHNLGIVIGDHRCIDEVAVEDLELFAGDLGMSSRMFKRDCGQLVERFSRAFERLVSAGGNIGRVATQIVNDAQERLRVVRAFCAG